MFHELVRVTMYMAVLTGFSGIYLQRVDKNLSHLCLLWYLKLVFAVFLFTSNPLPTTIIVEEGKREHKPFFPVSLPTVKRRMCPRSWGVSLCVLCRPKIFTLKKHSKQKTEHCCGALHSCTATCTQESFLSLSLPLFIIYYLLFIIYCRFRLQVVEFGYGSRS